MKGWSWLTSGFFEPCIFCLSCLTLRSRNFLFLKQKIFLFSHRMLRSGVCGKILVHWWHNQKIQQRFQHCRISLSFPQIWAWILNCSEPETTVLGLSSAVCCSRAGAQGSASPFNLQLQLGKAWAVGWNLPGEKDTTAVPFPHPSAQLLGASDSVVHCSEALPNGRSCMLWNKKILITNLVCCGLTLSTTELFIPCFQSPTRKDERKRKARKLVGKNLKKRTPNEQAKQTNLKRRNGRQKQTKQVIQNA